MSHTNSTTNYALPQFITTDKPAWLTDINGAFSTIDTAVDAAKDAADAAQNDATQALTDASTAATAAATADGKGAGAIASLADTFDPTTVYSVGDYVMYNSLLYICSVAVVTPGPWTGSANWSRTTVEAIFTGLTASTLPLNSGVGAPSTEAVINDLEDVTDISSSFVPNPGIANFDFFIRAYYNKGLGKISGTFACRVTSGTMGTVPMCTIGGAYKPNENIGFPMVATLAGGTTFYYCTFNTSGEISQNLTSNLTGVMCNFEYYV